MGSAVADRLDCYAFGAALMDAKDLDPVYDVVWGARLDPPHLRRWLLAYWDFYHVGTASWCSDSAAEYWVRMAAAAASKEYPRGTERRHFRGGAAVKAVEWQREAGVAAMFDPLRAARTYGEAAAAAREWPMFGPWISFKVADMVERLGLAPLRWGEGDIGLIYDSPAAGAAALHEEEGAPSLAVYGSPVVWALYRVEERLRYYRAPPDYTRPFGLAEAETCLCKWNSYRGGHYHAGKDVREVREALERFPSSPTAARLLAAGRGGRLWK